MLNEYWKPIKNFENLYQVSNLGRVSNYRKIMKPYTNNSGYKCIDLTTNSTRKKYLVHRLVAETFLENPEQFKVVNHIDGNKHHNSVDNLEWCTNSMNILHARRTGLNPYNFPTKGKILGGYSEYRGVGFDKTRGKWIGVIRVDGKNREQKRFDTEIEAADYVNYLIDKYHSDLPKNVFNF